VFFSTTVAKKFKNWFGGGWEFVVFVTVFVVKIVACKAKDGFGTVAGRLALVIDVGGQITAVVKAGEVASECLYEGLFWRDGKVVVDQKK